MKTFESKWEGNDGITFFIQGWEPDTAPKRCLRLFMGLENIPDVMLTLAR